MCKRILFFLILFIGLTKNYSQLSKIHYVNALAGEEVGDQWLYISTPSPSQVNVTVKPIGGSRTDWYTKTIDNENPWYLSVGSRPF